MKPPRPAPLEASVRQRLSNLARRRKEDVQFVLTRYGLERLLYRLSRSKHRDRFVLKGAMLFQLWTQQPHRPTRDLDFLGRGELDEATVAAIFADVCREKVPDDGVRFDEGTVRVERVREDQEYQGLRVTFTGYLAAAQLPVQIDIGTGDAVTPAAKETDFPTLLDDLPAPRLRAYPRETVVAEKFQAMVMLGMANSRVKDFYDLWVLARDFAFDGRTLGRAIAATFERRMTALPDGVPVALTPDFWQSGAKWRAFLSRNRLDAGGRFIDDVIDLLRRFLLPPAAALRTGTSFNLMWPPGGNWMEETGHT